jgi:hypothetical protein
VTVLIPEGAVTANGGLPVDDADETVDGDANPAALLAAAAAYHAAQTRLLAAAGTAARGLWQRIAPIDDASAGSWVSGWDALLASTARQQAALTTAYVRQLATLMGSPGFAVDFGDAVDPSEVQQLRVWLDGPAGRQVPEQVRDAAAEAVTRIGEGAADVADLAKVDRSRMLHSPVVAVRSELAAGRKPADAVAAAASDVSASTDAHARAVERVVMDATRWPRFKNGVAMMYKRVPQNKACGWCRIVATRLYSAKSGKASARWHDACRCTWTLVTLQEARTYAATLSSSRGDYFAAAESVGMWDGPGIDYLSFIRGNRGDGRAVANPSTAPKGKA